MACLSVVSIIILLFAIAFAACEAQTTLPPALGAELPDNGHKCTPTRVHLALGATQNDIRVSWATKAAGCSSKVHFGLVGATNAEDANATSNFWPGAFVADVVVSDSYGPGDFCAEPASKDDFDPPNLHSTVMTGLTPGQFYFYQIGHHEPVRQFKAPPAVGPDTSFRFIAYADVGESIHKGAKSPGAHLTMAQVEKEVDQNGAELLLHIGDLSYADGRHKIWDTFMELIEPYASRVAYQIAVGNHEYDWKTGLEKKHKHHTQDASGSDDPYDPNWGNYGNDSGGECGVPVSKLFTMTHAGSSNGHQPNAPFWFSYDYGSVHFTTVSTEHDLSGGSHQRKWLEHDLTTVDRCRTPWVVLLTHRPMYVVHPHKSNRIVGEHLRKFLEPVLEEHQVDLVLSGHVHAYARTCNVYEHECVSDSYGGTTHVTLGCGGRKLSSVQHDQPKWLDYAEHEFGFGRITVHGSRKLLFEYVRSEDGAVLDSRTLRVSHAATKGCGLSTEGPQDELLGKKRERWQSRAASFISAVQHVGDVAASYEGSAMSAVAAIAEVVRSWVRQAWRTAGAAFEHENAALSSSR